MKRLKLCLVVLKLWFLLRRSQILTVDSPEMWLLIITLRIPNNYLLPPHSDAIFKRLISFTSRLYSAHGLYDTIRFSHVLLTRFLLGFYDTIRSLYDTIRSYTIRYGSYTIRFLHDTIRFLHGTERFSYDTKRFSYDTIRF